MICKRCGEKVEAIMACGLKFWFHEKSELRECEDSWKKHAMPVPEGLLWIKEVVEL